MTSERPTPGEVRQSTADTARSMAPQRVPVNAYATPGAFVVLAPLPAVTADDVTVELEHGRLRFWAELRSAGPRDFLVHEWEYGGYERELDVPDGYGADVEASLVNGQLAVRVLAGEFVARRQVKPGGHDPITG